MGRILGPEGSTAVVPTARPPVGAPALPHALDAATPTPGRFWLITRGQTADELAQAALNAYQDGLGECPDARIAYLHCVAAGRRWNRKLYGSASTGPRYSRDLLIDGSGVRRAFGGGNDDARERIRSGVWPRRTITRLGVFDGRGSRFGLLWLPAVDGWRAQGAAWLPVCSELDPPELLLDALVSPGGHVW